MKRYLVSALLLSLPAAVSAHPDHLHTLGFADSMGHLLSSPDHLLLLLLSVAAAIFVGKKVQRWLRDRRY